MEKKINPLTNMNYAQNSKLETLSPVFEICNDAIIGMNTDKIIVHWNKAAEKIYGYTKEEAIGNPISFLYTSEKKDEVELLFDKLINHEKIMNYELHAKSKSNEEIRVSTSLTPVYSENGELNKFYSVSRDMTEQDLLIKELNNQQQRCEIALKESRSSIWEWNAQSNKMDFTHVYENLLGYDKDEIPNTIEGALKIIYPEDIQRVFTSFEENFDGNPLSVEYRMLCRDGEYRWFCLKGSITERSKNGVPLRKLGICYDINDKKQLEQELIKSEEKYRLLFTSTNQGIVLCELLLDRENDEIDVLFIDPNDSFIKILESKREMVAGRTFKELRDPNNPFDLRILLEVAMEGIPLNFEYYAPKVKKYLDVSSYRTQKGQFVLIVNDITERKIREQEIMSAKEEAVKANMAKSQFLANMSHEIRTPMNGILGFAQLLELTDLDAEQKEYVTTLKNSSHRLLEIINQILDISKLESEKVTLEKREFSLRKVVGQIINELSVSTYGKDIEVMHYIDPFITDTLIGDELRLMQVLTNLINNAVKFTNKGHIFFKVKNLLLDKQKIKLQFSIEDSGIGISNSYKNDIFSMFSQEDTSHTRKYGGTGLGLAISKSLVQLMNGDIWFESTLGKGTTFFFTAEFLLDIEESPAFSSQDEKSFVHLGSLDNVKKKIILPEEEHMQKKTILSAEDNLVNQKIISAYIRSLGYNCICVSDGTEVLDILDRTDIDLILMDIQMPKLNGFDTTALIRKKEEGTEKHLPIIAITAYALKGDRDKCLEFGVDDYVAKPFNLKDLSKMIKKYLP